jgi:anaerobic dimethyl sulfoxide reductase subunit B (iron-sulfur subunit)
MATTQYGFWVEPERCIKCWSCQVACKAWKGTKPGTISNRKVLDIWNGTFPTVTRTFISLSCMHCEKPACMAVCAVSAISKRADGIVVVDQAKCIGCKACSLACPYGVPQFVESGKMEKCDFCIDRVEAGKEPACVANCPTQALHSGSLDDLAKLAANKAGTRLPGTTQPAILISKYSGDGKNLTLAGPK